MALVIQSNPPVTGANSYSSLLAFKARLDSQLRVYAGKTDPQLEAALIAATEYMDTRFNFIGYRVAADQATEWPRQNAWDDRGDRVEGVPSQVIRACQEYAWRALTLVGGLAPDPVRDETGQAVQSKSSTVGPLSESVTYASVFATMPEYPQADRLLTSRGLVCKPSIGGFAVLNTARG